MSAMRVRTRLGRKLFSGSSKGKSYSELDNALSMLRQIRACTFRDK